MRVAMLALAFGMLFVLTTAQTQKPGCVDPYTGKEEGRRRLISIVRDGCIL
jgi:hypothetical protein